MTSPDAEIIRTQINKIKDRETQIALDLILKAIEFIETEIIKVVEIKPGPDGIYRDDYGKPYNAEIDPETGTFKTPTIIIKDSPFEQPDRDKPLQPKMPATRTGKRE